MLSGNNLQEETSFEMKEKCRGMLKNRQYTYNNRVGETNSLKFYNYEKEIVYFDGNGDDRSHVNLGFFREWKVPLPKRGEGPSMALPIERLHVPQTSSFSNFAKGSQIPEAS